MPGKMDKKDVKISFKDAKLVNWTRVQECSGAPIPSVAKQAVKDALENKKYKKLAVKIGLIKKDLYLRIKNGNDHVQDIRLVLNWTPPIGWVQTEVADVDDDDTSGGDEQENNVDDPVEEQYQRNLAAWKKRKEDAKDLGERVNAALKRLAEDSVNLADRAEIAAEQACSGQSPSDGFGRGTALPTATEMLRRIDDLVQQGDRDYQTYFNVYDVHRAGEKGEEFRREDKEGYGMAFFMQVLKPLDQNANMQRAALATARSKAQAAVQQITEYEQNGAGPAFLVKAQSIRQQAETLLQSSKDVLGGMTGDIEKMVTKGSGLFMDLESLVKSTTHDMKLAHADKALQRLTGIREAVPRMQAYLKELKILLSSVGKIPKDLAKNPPIKPELEAFARCYKETNEYHVQWAKHAATAESTYKEILKQVNK